MFLPKLQYKYSELNSNYQYFERLFSDNYIFFELKKARVFSGLIDN